MSWVLELWDDPEYASGASRLAFVDVWARANMKLSVDGTDTLSIIAPFDAEWLKTAQPRHVLKVTDELDRVTEWRIIRIFDGRGNDEAITQIECEGLLSDLSRPLVVQQAAGGAPNFAFNVYDVTATQLFDEFITPRLSAEGLSHYVKGTLSSSETMTFAFERYSVLELISEINNRTTTERWIERDDSANNYKVNIGTRGASEPTVRTAFSRGNLQSYIRDRDSLTVSTVTIPTGKKVDGAANKSTLGFNAWNVASVTGTTIELEDPAGADSPIAFDDQLNSVYVLRPKDAAAIDITDSSATGQTVTLASVPIGATYATQSTKQSALDSSLTLTLPTGAATGDLIAATVMLTGTGTLTAPSGWTTIINDNYKATGSTYGGRFWAGYIVRATGAPSTTVSWSPNGYYDAQTYLITNIASTGAVVDTATGRSDTNVAPQVDMSASGAGTVQLYLGGYIRGSVQSARGVDSDVSRFIKPGGTYTHSLSAASAGEAAATVAWTAGLAVQGTGIGIETGEQVQIVSDSDGSMLYELTNPSGVSSYGRIVGTVDDEELREERNWLRFGTFRNWTSGDLAPGMAMSSAPGISMRRVTSSSLKQIYSGTVTSVDATGGYYEIQMSGLPLGLTPSYGDLIQTSSGGLNHVREAVSIPVTSGGSYTMQVAFNQSTGSAFIGGPSTDGSIFTYSHMLIDARSLFNEDLIRVKYAPGYEQLWGSVGFTAWAQTTASSTAATGEIELYLTTTPAGGGSSVVTTTDYPAFTFQPTTWSTGGQISSFDSVIRATTLLTEDVDVQLRLFMNIADASIVPFANIRWMQLHLGTDSQVPPIYGSHGNRIWQRGNQHLRVFGTPPTTYQVSLIDLVRGEKQGLAIADDGIALGGKIRLVDADIGEVDLRIVELRLNGENPYDSTVTLATIPPRLAKIARRARFAPPTRPDPTPPTEKPADEQPGAPLPIILAPEIGVTAPATIKLVGDVWSLYA